MTKQEVFERALKAKEVIDGAGWLFDQLEAKYLQAIINSTPDKRELREEAYLFINNLKALRSELNTAVTAQASEDAMQEE